MGRERERERGTNNVIVTRYSNCRSFEIRASLFLLSFSRTLSNKLISTRNRIKRECKSFSIRRRRRLASRQYIQNEIENEIERWQNNTNNNTRIIWICNAKHDQKKQRLIIPNRLIIHLQWDWIRIYAWTRINVIHAVGIIICPYVQVPILIYQPYHSK